MRTLVVAACLLMAVMAIPAGSAIPEYSFKYYPAQSTYVGGYCNGGEIYHVYHVVGDIGIGYYDNQGEWNEDARPAGAWVDFEATGQPCTIRP